MLNVYEELAEESRRRILAALESGPKNVTELVRVSGLKQPNVSNHLARMRQRGIVAAKKMGREVFYELASPEVVEAVRGAIAPAPESIDLDIKAAATDYSRAAILGNSDVCQRILDHFLRSQTPLEEIYQELLQPSMNLIGSWYNIGAIDEAQEHLASEITERLLARTMVHRQPRKEIGKSAVLGCAPQNWHAIGLRMISDLMRTNGWTTFYMGPDVPTRSFVASVRRHRPDVVLISAGALGTEDGVEELFREVHALKSEGQHFTIVGGGRLIMENPGRYVKVGLELWAEDLRGFVHEVLPRL